MRKTIFLSLIIVFLLSCEKNDVFPTYYNFRLTKILNYSNSTDSEPYGFVEYKYNADGNLIRESMFDYPNTLYTYKEHIYGNNLKIRTNIYDGQVGNLRLGTYRLFSYENEKLVLKELYLGNGTLKYKTIFEYEADSLVNTYKVSDKLGVHHQHKYTYDNYMRLVLEESFMYNQQLESSIKHYYDDNDRLIKSESYDRNGEKTSITKKKYIGSNKLPSEVVYLNNEGIQTSKTRLLYDNSDNLIEIIYIVNNESHTLLKRKYNGKLLIESIRYSPNWGFTEWTVTRYEYSKI